MYLEIVFNISLDNKRVITEAMVFQYASGSLLSNPRFVRKYVEVRTKYYIISMINFSSKLSNDRKDKVKDDLFKLI